MCPGCSIHQRSPTCPQISGPHRVFTAEQGWVLALRTLCVLLWGYTGYSLGDQGRAILGTEGATILIVHLEFRPVTPEDQNEKPRTSHTQGIFIP